MKAQKSHKTEIEHEITKPSIRPRELEDYEPGATRSQVLEALKDVSLAKVEHKRSVKKCVEPPAEA